MRRRDLIAGAAAALAAGRATAAESPLRSAAREAYIFVFPLVEIASVRAAFLGAGNPAGRFAGRVSLSTPKSRAITTPNNDTLNAAAFIDLRAGPARIALPSLESRYACLALLDMYSNDFAVFDPRNAPRTVTLVGPRDHAPAGAIRAPTPWVWALVRTLVDGAADVPAALAVRDAFTITAAPSRPATPGAPRTAPWQDYFAAADRLLKENPPPAADAPLMARIAPLGLGSGRFDPGRFTGAEAADIAAGAADARGSLRTPLAKPRTLGAWGLEAPDTGAFGTDYETRARVALGGLAALPITEAMYLSAINPDGGRRFTGEGPWRLTFPVGATPPVDAFWSLTLYEATSEGQLFLTENPIGRYSIGDRTAGLVRDADGALTVWISRTDPGAERRANWLPAPAQGPFALTLRAYLPRPALVSHAYVPPPVLRVYG
jgi:hypothetical protein